MDDDVPGLKDDEDYPNDENDETEDDGTDDDNDGGIPPGTGMSIGGVVEDFVDNMDSFEQDLFEDFMLVIDDGLDIA